ncbi:phosphodiesterase [Parasphingopyxis algicola]|uniref:phosphodiesterase n=1 Tax=Parasphingopyxis algicola TaxID=2026624 RepID=UPI0015A1126B|nr:phosphodiesterase [Parasphingopyxis algicola]QLC23975.1 phosphodiesterase [Parasphingopyxis algicola]
MLIAQITDIHLGFDPDDPAEFNRRRLDQVLERLCEMTPRPDLLLATGDLTDKGDTDSYRRLKSAFGRCPFPVWPCVGNHDDRDGFSKLFPEVPKADGFVQYVIDEDRWPLRLIVLDTLEPGRHGGAFCDVRAAWLSARLAEKPDKPALIVLHHPPIETGIPWMTTEPEAAWVKTLRETLTPANNIVGMVAGHIHRPILTGWAGLSLAVVPSTAPQVALDLRPIDPGEPDNRPMIIADPPAYALHYWNGRSLISHLDDADDHVQLARYDETMQPLVRYLIDEHASDRK